MSAATTMPTPVKKCPRPHAEMVTYLLRLAGCLEGNAYFPNPSPTVARIRGSADALAHASAAAAHGDPAAVSDRKAKRRDAEALVDELLGYVKVTVRAQTADPDVAAVMILSAGFSLRKSRRNTKPQLAARHGAVSTEVLLVARAVARTAVYFWEYSLDQVTWTALPSTLQARTTVGGLVPGQVHYFRFRAQTRKGMGDPSDAVRLMVI
jgi:hypothetical protein